VQEGQDVWTGIFGFPGFLSPGWYVATVSGVRSATGAPAELVVRVDGHPVVTGGVGPAPATLRGVPFRVWGIERLDLRVRGAPVHLDEVRLDRAPAPVR
jgi:hypothetical protein